jgi:hypothetical protein
MKNAIIGIAILAVSATSVQDAFAKRARDNPNYGYCADGKRVTDVAKCPEFKTKASSKKK